MTHNLMVGDRVRLNCDYDVFYKGDEAVVTLVDNDSTVKVEDSHGRSTFGFHWRFDRIPLEDTKALKGIATLDAAVKWLKDNGVNNNVTVDDVLKVAMFLSVEEYA